MIDSLFWLFERLSSFDLENDLFFEFIKFMIKLLNNYLEYLCRLESLIAFLGNSMNVLKKNQSFKSLKSFSFDINVFNFKYLSWYSTVNSIWWWLTKYFFNRNIINLISFNQSRLNVSINLFFISSEKDEDRHSLYHVRLFSFQTSNHYEIVQIDDESSYKNIWTERIVNVKNDRRNRDTDFKIFRIYYSKFKKYMTLIRFVKKLNKLAMRIFMSQKIHFLNYTFFDERLLQKQSNQITTFIFLKFTSYFEITRIKTEIILCM